MRKVFWKDDAGSGGRPISTRGGRQKRLDINLARQVVADWMKVPKLPSDTVLTCVDCRGFYGTFNGHAGLHEDVQREYFAQNNDMNACIDYLIQNDVDPVTLAQEGGGRHDRPKQHIVAFYSNAGEHRSVALAALFAQYAENKGCKVDIRHICSSLWSRRSCGQCSLCPNRPTDVILNMFKQAFDTRRAEHARKRRRHDHFA